MDNPLSLGKKSLELKKHVAAIHSASPLSLVQRKIANALLYHAYDNLLTQNEHHIHIVTLSNLIGFDSKDFKIVKEALVALISAVIEWNLIDRSKAVEHEVWNASSIIADATIDGPICSYSYSNKMRELLYRPEFYGRLNMQILARFKSSYGLALYENCIRYQNIGHTAKFELEVFRKLMGVEKGKYPIFRDFKRRVLDVAIAEVNKYSPITLEVRLGKKNRNVQTLQFLITKSQDFFPQTDEATMQHLVESPLKKRLKGEYGLSNKQINKIVANYDDKYILEKILVIESSSTYQNGAINNLARYLEKALEDDYQPAKSSQEQAYKLQKEKEQHLKQQKKREQQISEYQEFQNKEILRLYGDLPDDKRQALQSEFEQDIEKTVYYDIFMKESLDHPLVQDCFCRFVRKHKHVLLEKGTPFSKFLEGRGD